MSESDPVAARKARFDSMESNPRYQELLDYRPDPSQGRANPYVMLAVAVVLLIVNLFALNDLRPDALRWILRFACAFGGIMLATHAILRMSGAWTAPLELRPAVVAGSYSTKVRGFRQAFNTLTLEFRSGDRIDCPIPARATRDVAPGDLGMAYLHKGRLVEFKRLPE